MNWELNDKDQIKELFSDKLGNYEAPVRPDMWSNIASQLGGSTTTVASTGLSLLSKTFIGLGIGAAVVTTAVLLIPSENKPIQNQVEVETPAKIAQDTSEPNMNQETVKTDNKVRPINKEESSANKTQTNERTNANELHEINSNDNFKSDVTLISETKKDIKLALPPVASETEKSNNEAHKPIQKEPTTPLEKTTKEEENKEVETQSQPKLTYTISKLPNIFTPDGDGTNDIFSVESEGLVDFTIVVLDERQKVVFESNNPDFEWNGMDKFGNKVNPGNYGYYIIARDSNGNKVNKFVSLQIVF